MQYFEPQQQPPPFPPAAPKRRRFGWLFALLVMAIVAGAFLFVAVGLVSLFTHRPTLAQGSVLEIHLAGTLAESPDAMAGIFPGLAGPPSLFEIRDAVLLAADDPNIAAIKLDIEQSGCGWAQMQELLTAVDAFRGKGKQVRAFLRGDIVTDIDYALALAADRIWVAPQAAFFVNGLRAEVEFWRGTLDLLHIEPQYFMMKEYKSAGEINSRYEMSEYFREATTDLLGDIWTTAVDLIATRRKLEPSNVRDIANRGVLTPREALDLHLVDELGYEEDIREELRTLAATPTYQEISVRRYLDRGHSDDAASRVAVVFGEGPILSSSRQELMADSMSGPRVAAAIRRAADDESFAAILFRVNSPGGSPVGSDHVWRAIEYARTVRHKPVIVSFSTVAGSGGYWVAMGADAIVAHETTMTGSIGVVFGKLNVKGLFALAGGNVDSLQTADNADLLSLVTSFNPQQTYSINAWLVSTYDDFKRKVATGRKLDADTVENIARGRVWSGVDAQGNGLVDRLGGYDVAIDVIREKANIERSTAIKLVPYPSPSNLFEILFSDDSANAVAQALRARSPLDTLAATRDPRRALDLVLEELSRPGVWLVTPTLHIF